VSAQDIGPTSVVLQDVSAASDEIDWAARAETTLDLQKPSTSTFAKEIPMSRKIASLLAAALVIAVSTGSASAERNLRKTSEEVFYGDLDLSSVAGVKTLKIRLNSAIDRVCGKPFDTASFTNRRLTRSCRETALNESLASINVPALTATYPTVAHLVIAQR
jgi:UrcA family protein